MFPYLVARLVSTIQLHQIEDDFTRGNKEPTKQNCQSYLALVLDIERHIRLPCGLSVVGSWQNCPIVLFWYPLSHISITRDESHFVITHIAIWFLKHQKDGQLV